MENDGFLCVCVLVAQLHLTLYHPWTVAHQAPLSMGFSRQEYWSGLPFPSPGDLLNPGLGLGLRLGLDRTQSPALQTVYHLSHQRNPLVS